MKLNHMIIFTFYISQLMSAEVYEAEPEEVFMERFNTLIHPRNYTFLRFMNYNCDSENPQELKSLQFKNRYGVDYLTKLNLEYLSLKNIDSIKRNFTDHSKIIFESANATEIIDEIIKIWKMILTLQKYSVNENKNQLLNFFEKSKMGFNFVDYNDELKDTFNILDDSNSFDLVYRLYNDMIFVFEPLLKEKVKELESNFNEFLNYNFKVSALSQNLSLIFDNFHEKICLARSNYSAESILNISLSIEFGLILIDIFTHLEHILFYMKCRNVLLKNSILQKFSEFKNYWEKNNGVIKKKKMISEARNKLIILCNSDMNIVKNLQPRLERILKEGNLFKNFNLHNKMQSLIACMQFVENDYFLGKSTELLTKLGYFYENLLKFSFKNTCFPVINLTEEYLFPMSEEMSNLLQKNVDVKQKLLEELKEMFTSENYSDINELIGFFIEEIDNLNNEYIEKSEIITEMFFKLPKKIFKLETNEECIKYLKQIQQKAITITEKERIVFLSLVFELISHKLELRSKFEGLFQIKEFLFDHLKINKENPRYFEIIDDLTKMQAKIDKLEETFKSGLFSLVFELDEALYS